MKESLAGKILFGKVEEPPKTAPDKPGRKRGIFHKIGQNLIKGATAEINENPPKILDADRILDKAEIILGLGLAGIAVILLIRKPKPQTVVHIHNLIIKQ